MSAATAPELTFAVSDLTKMLAERREMVRLQQQITDEFLGYELLKLARTIRRSTPPFDNRDVTNYTGVYLWDYVPGIAKLLGARVQEDEALDEAFNSLDVRMIRKIVATSIKHVRQDLLGAVSYESRFHPSEILFRDYRAGSPIVFALDRLGRPNETFADGFSIGLREFAQSRNFQPQEEWHPDLLEPLPEDEDEAQGYSAPILALVR